MRFLPYDVQEQSLYIGLDIKSKKKADANAAAEIQPLELLGFGSGDFAEGPEAGDIMGDITGRWLSYALGASSEQVILEVDKRLPEHIRKSDIFGKARASCYFFTGTPSDMSFPFRSIQFVSGR